MAKEEGCPYVPLTAAVDVELKQRAVHGSDEL
jgi:hypothetical protein